MGSRWICDTLRRGSRLDERFSTNAGKFFCSRQSQTRPLGYTARLQSDCQVLLRLIGAGNGGTGRVRKNVDKNREDMIRSAGERSVETGVIARLLRVLERV